MKEKIDKIIHILPLVISVIAMVISLTKPKETKEVVAETPKTQQECKHDWETLTEDKNNHSIVLSCNKCGLIKVINTLRSGEY